MAGNVYDQFDTPAAGAAGAGAGGAPNIYDKLDGPDPGALSDFAHGLKAGGLDVPKMAGEGAAYVGRAMHSAGNATGLDGLEHLGDQVQQKAEDWSKQYAASQDADAGQQQSLQGQEGGLIRRNIYGVGKALGNIGATSAASAGAGALYGSVVGPEGTVAGAVTGAVTGAVRGMTVVLPILFGLSTGENTAQGVEQAQTAKGTDAETAKNIGLGAGAATGVVASVAEAALAKVGLGDIAAPYLNKLTGAASGKLVQTMLQPTLKGTARDIGLAAVKGAAVNAGQQDAIEGINAAGGYGDGPSVQGTADALVQGGLIAGSMHSVSGPVHSSKVRGTAALLADPTADPTARQNAAIGAGTILATKDPALATDFAAYADAQIKAGQPIQIGDDSIYTSFAADQRAQQDAGTDAAQRTTAQDFPNFRPTGDEVAAQNGPIQDNGIPANQGQDHAGMVTPDLNQPMPADLARTANPAPLVPPVPQTAPPTITDTIGTIMHAGSVDDAVAAAEQTIGGSAAEMVKKVNDIGEAAGVITPNGAELTPSADNLAQDRDYYQGQANAAQNDVRQQAFDQAQAAPAPAAPADPFAARQAQLDAQAAAQRDAGHAQMNRDQLAQQADTAGQVSNATEAAQPAPQPTALSRAMSGSLDRAAARMQGGKQVSTLDLGMLAQHHPDPTIQKQAADALELRKNKDIVQPEPDAAAAPADGSTPFSLNAVRDGGNFAFSTQRGEVDPAVKPVQDALDKQAQAQGLPQAEGAITPVDVASLPETRTAANNGREGSTTLSQGEAGLLQRAASIFGKKLVLYRQEGGDTAHDGMVLKSDPSTIYVNADAASAHHLVVFGHELAHQLRADAPKLFDTMRQSILKEAGKGAQSEFMKYYAGKDMTPEQVKEAFKDKATADSMTEEFVSDLVGNRFSEYRTWQTIFANAPKENRGMVYRIADYITKFIDHLLANTSFKKFATDDMVNNLNAVRQTVRRALSDYSALQGGKAMQHEADQLKARQANKAESIEPKKLVEPVDDTRAFVGKAPSKAAPAPVAERSTSDVQGSRDIEAMEPPKKYGKAPVKAEPAAVEQPKMAAPAPTLDSAKEAKAAAKAEREARNKQIAEEAAQELANKKAKATESASKGARTRYKVDAGKDSMLTALAKLGGVNRDEVSKLYGTDDKSNHYYNIAQAITKNGMSVDEARSRMAELGYVKTDEHGKADIQDFDDKFNEGLDGGDQHYTPAGLERLAQKHAEDEFAENQLRAHDAENAGYQELSDETQGIVGSIFDEHGYAEDGALWKAASPEEIGAVADRLAQHAEDDRGLSAADEAPTAGREEESGARSGETDEGASREPGSDDEGENFGLTGESQAEGEARTAREEADRTEQARQAKQADQRAQADAELGSFQLRGSDREADANPGQDALFSRQRAPDFGAVHDQYQDDPAGAIARLMQDKSGEATAVVTRDGIGPISLVYGDKTMGLAHIAERRGHDFLEKLPALLKDGTVYSQTEMKGRVYIGDKHSEAVVRLDWDGKEKTWLVTAYDRLADRRKPWMDNLKEVNGPASTTSLDDVKGTTQLTPESRRSEGSVDPGESDIKPSTMRASYLGKMDSVQEAAAKAVGMLRDPKTLKQQLTEYKDGLGKRLEQGIAHRYAPIRDVSKEGFMQARVARGSDGTLEATLLYGKPTVDADGAYDVKIDPKGGFAKTLASLKGEHNRFFLWVAAHRAEDLLAQGKEKLFTQKDIDALKTLDQPNADGTNSDRPALFKAALKDYQDYNKSILDIAEKSGLIDSTLRDDLAKHMFVPFYRTIEDGNDVKGPRNVSGLVNQYAFKKLKGSTDVLNDDLMANVMQNWSHLLGAAARNRAARTTLEAAESMGIADKIAHPSDAPKGSVKVMVDGKSVIYDVHEKPLLSAISAMYADVPGWMKPLSTFKHWLTFGVTSMPGFKLRNLIRDTITTAGISDASNPWTNLSTGWKATAHDSQTRASMLASGGMIRFGNLAENGSATAAHRLVMAGVPRNTILDNPASLKAFGETLHAQWEKYAELGDRSENINRAALYEKLKAEGKSHLEASFAARDLLDFSDGGTYAPIQFLVQSVPFMNARIQGLFKLGEAIKDPKMRGKLAMVAGGVVMASLSLMLLQQDDPDWKAREDWDRDNYWWVKVGGTAFRIPKPFELGAVGTMAERAWELMSKDHPEMTAGRFGKDVGTLLGNQFNLNPVPQIVKPFADVYSNRDSFTGRQIESQAMQKQMAQDRYSVGTSMTARFLSNINLPDPVKLVMNSEWDRLSPVQWDALLKGYFGGAGQTISDMVDSVARPALGQPSNPGRGLLSEQNLTMGVAQPLPAQQSRYMTDYYDSLTSIEQAYNSYHQALKTGRRDEAKQILADNRTLIGMYSMAEAAKRTESNLALMMKRVQNSTTMDDDTKKARLQTLNQQRIKLATSMQTRIQQRQSQQ